MHRWPGSAVVMLAFLLLFSSAECMITCVVPCPAASHRSLPPCHRRPAPTNDGSHACSHPLTMAGVPQSSSTQLGFADSAESMFVTVVCSPQSQVFLERLQAASPSPPG